jgi:hypothetical protein
MAVPGRDLAVRTAVCALLGYMLVAVFFTWPLARNPGTRLLAPAGGDTAVYLWNNWIFRHEIAVHHASPLETSHILAPATATDLSLHNYTLFANLLAFPQIPRLGLIAAFNVVYLVQIVLAACAMFLLAWSTCRHAGAAWLAGAAFGFSPMLTARGLGHFSLVGAAPLPIFLFFLLRAMQNRRTLDAVGAGAAMAWAAVNDPYYGVYCVLMTMAWIIQDRLTAVRVTHLSPAGRRLGRAAGAVASALLIFSVAIAVSGGWEVQAGGVRVSMHSLYTPVLLLAACAAVWAAVHVRPARRRSDPTPVRDIARLAALAGVTCAAFLWPLVPGLVDRLRDGDGLAPPVPWRSSPRGADLLAFVAPNPMNPLIGGLSREWLQTLPNGVVENTASLPIVAIATVAIAAWRSGFVLPRLWAWLLASSAALALGPFLHIGGINTHVPGPWMLMRYVPLIGSARMPGRLAVVVALAVAMLFAFATVHLLTRQKRRGTVLAVLGALLLFELSPLPRRVYGTDVPAVYDTIREDGREVRVLELPFGIRDGVLAIGGFDPAVQYFQTFHEKPIFGGYISRLPAAVIEEHRRNPVLRTLLSLSVDGGAEAERPSPAKAREAALDLRVGYVVMESGRVSPQLRAFAVETFGLIKIEEAEGRELFRPSQSLSEPDRQSALRPLPALSASCRTAAASSGPGAPPCGGGRSGPR